MRVGVILAALAAASAFAGAVEKTPEEDGWWRRKDGFGRIYRYDSPDTTPIVFGGESRAENVKAREYCLYLDVRYADGTADWRLRCVWRQGTHGWERIGTYFLPRKPVAQIDAFAFVRDGTGSAEYRGLYVRRETPVTPLSAGFTQANPVDAGRLGVWCAPASGRVTPHVFPESLPAHPAISLEMAANERESAQIVIAAGPLATASVDMSVAVPGLSAKWERVGFLHRDGAYEAHPLGAPLFENLLPDPLLPAGAFKLRENANNPLWLTVYAPPGTARGTYRGEALLSSAGRVVRRIPISVKVRGVELPRRISENISFSLMDGFTKAFYPDCFEERRRQSWDIMLDHRLSPDDIARTEPPRVEDLERAARRGMNLFTIANFVPPSRNPHARWTCVAPPEACFDPAFYDSFAARLKPYVAELRRRGLLKDAFFYGFDERGEAYFDGMREVRAKLKRDFPDVPFLTTAFVCGRAQRDQGFRERVLDMADWLCPVADAYDEGFADGIRRRGGRVWWYLCGGNPPHPYANFSSVEYPPFDARVISWLTYLVRADGFLYWSVNCWDTRPSLMDEDGLDFPEWHLGDSRSPCGGVLLYPGRRGIMPSIRLANVRDGVEDFELLKLVEKACGRAVAERFARRIASSVTDFNRDPEAMRSVRSEMFGLCERRRAGRKPTPFNGGKKGTSGGPGGT